MTTTFLGFEGRPLHVGDRVRPISWGGDVRLSDCGMLATVVGFGRTRVRVRYDGKSYGGKWPEFDTVDTPTCLRHAEDIG